MLVSLDNVAMQFEDEGPLLFERVSCTCSPGDVVVVTGPSGSGKSTLLSLIAGMERPTSGEIRLVDVASIMWVFQNPYGSPKRLSLDHVTLPLLVQGATRIAAESEAMDIMVRFGLAKQALQPFGQLSGGQAQRLMLARAVAASASVYLVDEPTAQLDRASSSDVIDVLGELADQDRIVFIATHDRQILSLATKQIALA